MPPPTTTSESFLSGACGLRDHHQHRRRPSSSASGGNSYYGRGAYADPRCEMKKRQQQEIVVSGLTINTSDISSGEEEEEEAKAEKDKGNLTNAGSSFLVADEMSLIEETSVRKVGGGGALSTSIFQVFILIKPLNEWEGEKVAQSSHPMMHFFRVPLLVHKALDHVLRPSLSHHGGQNYPL